MSGLRGAADLERLAAELRAYVDSAIASLRVELSGDLDAAVEGLRAHIQGLREAGEHAAAQRAARRATIPEVHTDAFAMYRAIVDGLSMDVVGILTRLEVVERWMAEMRRG